MTEFSWITDAAKILAAAGPWGFVAVVCWVARLLWNEVKDRDKLITTLQETRAKEAATFVKSLTEVATSSTLAITVSTQSNERSLREQQAVLDVVRVLPPAIETISRNLERNSDKLEDIHRALSSGPSR